LVFGRLTSSTGIDKKMGNTETDAVEPIQHSCQNIIEQNLEKIKEI
jgi:hypothetical protein